MKAKDFIRNFGWGVANEKMERHFYNEAHPCPWGAGIVFDIGFDDELKKYTDAYELVRSYGGLGKAKQAIFDGDNHCMFIDLEQAITLVEEVGDCDV